jgi:hypothetical protein
MLLDERADGSSTGTYETSGADIPPRCPTCAKGDSTPSKQASKQHLTWRGIRRTARNVHRESGAVLSATAALTSPLSRPSCSSNLSGTFPTIIFKDRFHVTWGSINIKDENVRSSILWHDLWRKEFLRFTIKCGKMHIPSLSHYLLTP